MGVVGPVEKTVPFYLKCTVYFTPSTQSEVGMALCYRLDLSNCLSIPTEATEIFLFRNFQICFGEEPASYLMGK